MPPIDTEKLLAQLRADPGYANQMVHIRHEAKTAPAYGRITWPLTDAVRRVLANLEIERLYTHQVQAFAAFSQGRNVVVATGTASGKSLCYWLPILEVLAKEPNSTVLLLFPTKALCQDQLRVCKSLLATAGFADAVPVGVIDGDTPGAERRGMLEQSRILFTNPDMLHTNLLPNHVGWARFLSHLRLMVLDELHTYNGLFGSNSAHLFFRCRRIFRHYGAEPQLIACSATLANPQELAEKLTGCPFELVDDDGSPRGERTYVLWNPPITRPLAWYSRRSANVEAHEIMAFLLRQGVRTITFSKAKMTAEMICRYVQQNLAKSAPRLVDRVTAYRGGYVPSERREIEKRLFTGELMGISTTRALELGIDVGGLDACIIVGYPGNSAAFRQQAGRVGRREGSSLVVLVTLDTPINQYIAEYPEYLFGKPVEAAIIEPRNPFISVGQLRCAARELPINPTELEGFYPDKDIVLRVLQEQKKLMEQNGRYYHIAPEVPHHEVRLRGCSDATVVVQDAESGKALGHLERYDAGLLVHPGAVYMHQGNTYISTQLDWEKGIALVVRKDVSYYTQPFGGTGLDHIDRCHMEKQIGQGMVCWGEVTTRFVMAGYERIPFFEMDAVSNHWEQLTGDYIQTTAVWMSPFENILKDIQASGLNVASGLQGIAYATHAVMPLHITCDTYDFWHQVGCVNAPKSTMFIYEHHPYGLGFTRRAFDVLPDILRAVHQLIAGCQCDDGCPRCVGSPLRRDTTRNVERGEGSIPSRKAALSILDRWLSSVDDARSINQAPHIHRHNLETNLEQELRRHLERQSAVDMTHPIVPWPATSHTHMSIQVEGDRSIAGRRGSSLGTLHKELNRRLMQGGLKPGDQRRE